MLTYLCVFQLHSVILQHNQETLVVKNAIYVKGDLNEICSLTS